MIGRKGEQGRRKGRGKGREEKVGGGGDRLTVARCMH